MKKKQDAPQEVDVQALKANAAPVAGAQNAPNSPTKLSDEDDSDPDVEIDVSLLLREPNLTELTELEALEDPSWGDELLESEASTPEDESSCIPFELTLLDDDDDEREWQESDGEGDGDDGDLVYSAGASSGTTYRDALAYHVGRNMKHPLLSKEDEQRLGREVAQGSEAAFYAMFCANLRLVVSIARRYANRCRSGLSMEDLVAEGNMGLMIAVRRFDPEMGTRFTTYASYWIRQSIVRQVEDQCRPVRIPLSTAQLYARYARLKWQKSNQGLELPDHEAMELLEINSEMMARLHEISLFAVSMDGVLDPDSEKSTSLQDTMFNDADTLDEQVAHQDKKRALLINMMNKHLTARELEVLRGRFGFDGTEGTLKGIASSYGLSRERVRQVEEMALRKLRRAMSVAGLSPEHLLG